MANDPGSSPLPHVRRVIPLSRRNASDRINTSHMHDPNGLSANPLWRQQLQPPMPAKQQHTHGTHRDRNITSAATVVRPSLSLVNVAPRRAFQSSTDGFSVNPMHTASATRGNRLQRDSVIEAQYDGNGPFRHSFIIDGVNDDFHVANPLLRRPESNQFAVASDAASSSSRASLRGTFYNPSVQTIASAITSPAIIDSSIMRAPDSAASLRTNFYSASQAVSPGSESFHGDTGTSLAAAAVAIHDADATKISSPQRVRWLPQSTAAPPGMPKSDVPVVPDASDIDNALLLSQSIEPTDAASGNRDTSSRRNANASVAPSEWSDVTIVCRPHPMLALDGSAGEVADQISRV